MQNKTFRLFVSSTFSDFNEERKLLQTIVFPEIKKYCRDNGLNFQPIDLRWGVTEEASNDQKTLSLCLEEVQSSKYHPYPNFLIMAGDRYGWIPLPYAIEQNEYETILKNIDDLSDKELLNTWYKLDENQIPSSYILNERKKSDSSHDGVDYTNKDNWRKIENQLKTILQTSVKKSDLNEKQKRKYFTSATEAEVIEGIFKYLDKTEFQNKLLEKDSTLENKDYESVYAYIRNIKSISNLKDKFIDMDLIKVNDFKNEIKKSINSSNILESDVNLINVFQDEKNGSLNYEYETILDNENSLFVKKMVEYFKSSIDKHIEISKDISIEELEKYEQERFKKSKLKDFLEGSRKEVLTAIDNYINNDNNQALVIYGKSGLGKSSLMAKAIQNAEDKYRISKKLIYRFVGSRANLNSSAEVLISILQELGIDEEIKKVINPQTQKEENEKIDEFYYRVEKHLFSIEIEIILFIDAIDQINNEDKFLWLPNTLPKELKIIISVLNDSDYEEDSKYFRILETKIKKENLYSLEQFENPKELINSLLSQYDRKITEKQMDYLLSKEDSNSPLYLSIAAQEIRHWKSYDNSQNLATNQKEIIREFTQNLTKLFHHDEEFVKRIFTYLYISQGLSESELLELISSDEEFISKIAPETYNNNNDTKELPIVIWARLHTQIKEFLKLENKDGQETMNFFHREFFDSIKKLNNLEIIQEDFISLLHIIITKYKDKSFLSNRWGELFIEVIKSYYLKYEFDDSNYQSPKIEKWRKIIIEEILHSNRNLYNLNKEKMIETYLESLNYLANSLSYIGKTYDTIDLVTESLNIIKPLYFKNPNDWQSLYLDKLRRLSNFYYHIDKIETVINFYKEIIIIMKSLYNKYPNTWSETYIKDLENLAYAFELDENKKESIRYRVKALHIKKDLYNKNS